MTAVRREYRCPHCEKKIVVGQFTGWVEVVCPRCGKKVAFGN